MKIIMPFGPAERNDGACFYIPRWIKWWGKNDLYQVKAGLPPSRWPEHDAVLYLDWAQDAYSCPPPAFPQDKKCVLWLSDTHMGETARENRFKWAMSAPPDATILFYHPEAIQDYVNYARGTTQQVGWLPAAADHTIYPPPLPREIPNRNNWSPDPYEIDLYTCEVVPQRDWVWVGHVGDAAREDALDRMCREFPSFSFWSGLYFEYAAREFHKSAVVFNKSVRGDLNMRTFEVLSTRSFLLTDRQRGMDGLGLRDGEHCAIYDTMEEAVEKMRFYLDRPALRDKIRRAGWEWVLNGHTYWHRAKTLLGHLGDAR